MGMSLGDVLKFLAGHVGFVKGDGRHISFSLRRATGNPQSGSECRIG